MIYLFDRYDTFVQTEGQINISSYKRDLGGEWTFEFECPFTTQYVKGNKIGVYDKDNIFRYFVITDIEDDFEEETTKVTCIVEYVTLGDGTIEDKRVVQGSCAAALTKLLEGTKFKVGIIEPSSIENINYYFEDRYTGLVNIIKIYGGEVDYRVVINDKNVITDKILDIKHNLGTETGLRCTYDTNLKSLRRKIHNEGHYTVLYGRGASLETEGGGNSRLLTFDGVTWTTPTNPLNKPNADKFLVHPDAVEKWGRIEGQYQNDKIQDKTELLEATHRSLLTTIEPKISYESTIKDIQNIKGFEHYKYSLGDTIHIINEDKDIIVTARITHEEYDIMKPSYIDVKLGDIWETLTDKNDSNDDGLKDYIDNIVGGLDTNVDDTKFPNTLPNAPVLAGRGGLDSISISWTYENKSYYSYELHASKTKDFQPTAATKVFEGQASLYIHDCKPKETWYFRGRAKNTHGEYTSYSNQLTVDTTKIDDGAIWIENGAIGELLVGTLRLDRGWIGKLAADLLDVNGKFRVVDGNGHVTFEVDSFGRIHMDVTSLSIQSKDIMGELAINMLPNSNFAMIDKTDLWYFWQSDYAANGCSWYLDQHGLFPTGEGLGLSSHPNQSCTATSQTVSVEHGETYTLSLDLNVEHNVISAGVMFRYYDQEGNTIGEHKTDYTPGYHGRISLSMKMENERIKKMNILIWNNGATVDNKEYVVVFFNRIQLQKGKVATPWKLGTNDTMTARISQILVDAEGIRNQVATIEGDYVTGTQFTQTNNQFRYEFLNSGSDNELWNSDFSQGGRSWTLTGGDRVIVETNAGYGGGGIPVNSGVRIGDCTDATACAFQAIKPKNPNSTKYRIGCWVWMGEVYDTQGTGSSMSDIYIQVRYKDGSSGWPSFNMRDFVGHTCTWTWIDFMLYLENKAVEAIEFFVYKRNTSGTMRITQIYFREGDIPSNKWKAHPGEVHSNTTVVDGQGIEITHSSGAKSRMTHECNEFTAANGNKTLRIKDGGLNFFTWETPEMTGFIKPTSMAENAIYNGVALSTYANGDYIAIGHSDHADENGWKCYPYILVAKHDLGYQGYRQGINLNQRTLVHNPMHFYNILDMATMKPIELAGNTTYNSQIYGYDGGGLAIFGDNATRIGYRDGTTNKVGFEINEAHGYQNNCLLKLWGEFDFQNYKVHNFRATYNLEPKNPYTKDKMKRQDKKLYTSYTTTNNEIRHSGKDTTSLYECIVEIPGNIAEHIQNDYIVHLTKCGRGDIWIKETNPYYFIVESDVENLGFSYEVVAKELEKVDIETRFTKDYKEVVETPVIEEPQDMSYIDSTEDNNFDYWKLYRK